MILNIVYNHSHLSIIEELEHILKNYPLVKLVKLNEESHSTKKDAYKLKGRYGAKISPFANLTDDEKVHVAAFYSEDKSFDLGYIKDVLNHWILYKPIENGRVGSEEKT
jgi:predicted nucleic acid-binding protein